MHYFLEYYKLLGPHEIRAAVLRQEGYYCSQIKFRGKRSAEKFGEGLRAARISGRALKLQSRDRKHALDLIDQTDFRARLAGRGAGAAGRQRASAATGGSSSAEGAAAPAAGGAALATGGTALATG